nr:DUF4830 domain-containing protein [Pseudoflavonifractor phocaeensis]
MLSVGAAAALCAALFTAAALWCAQDHTAASAAVDENRVSTNEDRVAYLQRYGWQVDPDPLSVEELLLPEVFDERYTAYLDLQAQQGFDLTACAGKRVKRYVYQITNYPTGETGIQAGLLIFRDTVVGGDVLSTALDGFMHGLTMPT